jgi:hypothetical protein
VNQNDALALVDKVARDKEGTRLCPVVTSIASTYRVIGNGQLCFVSKSRASHQQQAATGQPEHVLSCTNSAQERFIDFNTSYFPSGHSTGFRSNEVPLVPVVSFINFSSSWSRQLVIEQSSSWTSTAHLR